MAYYLVRAKPKSDRLRDLLGNLRKHIYSPMRPFGKAMTYALENARLREDGYALWEEEDYCSPPLAQERAAALDEFFEELQVTPVREGEGWKAGVDGSVSLVTLGAGGTIDTNNLKDPIVAFVLGQKGLMYNLSFEGTKFTKLNK